MLELRKWLRSVEKVGLLHLLWIPHFHCTPITSFNIRQLLCLVHDGYLWLEEPIPIMADLIHRISRLPCKWKDPVAIAGKSRGLAFAEAMKKKFKMEKKKRGYAISTINNNAVRVATQVVAGKVMRKCCVDEVPMMVVHYKEKGHWWGEKCHHKLIGDSQNNSHHRKQNVTKGHVTKSIGVVVTFEVLHK